MATIKKYNPGDFCWVDLGTTDVAGAKKFYRGLLGWQAKDMPMGDGDAYTMLKVKGKEVCAFYPMSPDQKKSKTPPFWLPYIAVTNIERTVKNVKAAGGIVCMGPTDVFKAGRLAVFQDPLGARFAIWQAKANIGTKLKGVTGTVGWRDLNTSNPTASGKFYTKVFGWKIETKDFSGNAYHLLKLGRNGIGGIWPHPLPKHPPAWITYWFVESVTKTMAKAKRLGGKVILGPITVPETCTFAIIRDPQGATLGVLEPLEM